MKDREKYRRIINTRLCEFLGVKSTGNISIFADALADELFESDGDYSQWNENPEISGRDYPPDPDDFPF